MAFQRGFPSKLNVPQRKIETKKVAGVDFSGYKGRAEVDNIARVNRSETDKIQIKRMPGIKGEAAGNGCK